MKYQALLFDADGVLIQNKHLFSERLSKEYGIPLEKMQPFFYERFPLCGIGKADLKEELAKVINVWGWPGTVDTILDFWLKQGTEIDAEMQTLVQTMHEKGIRTYLVTDQERYRGEYLRTLFEGNIFDHVYYSAELGVTKNQPVFWEKVIADSALEVHSSLYIDDGKDNLLVAQAAGLKTFLYTGDKHTLEQALSV